MNIKRQMLIIQNNNSNPYFNIASEEYLLKNFDEDIFMLYINNPSIIVGKHQNTIAEVNFPYIHKHNIPVVRRLSGGGTVFHDPGNLNFAFFQNGSEGNLVNFKKFTTPIIAVLQSLGVDARLEGKNDLRVNGLKISGNAEHVFKRRVIHHGTLLFNSELEQLREAIKVKPGKYTDKAVQSIRSNVTNIYPFLKEEFSTSQFKKSIEDFIKVSNNDWQEYSFSPYDLIQIETLQKEKFRTWEWNFGYSPNYMFQNEIKMKDWLFEIKLWIEKGKITEYEVLSSEGKNPQEDFLTKLTGKYHKLENISELLSNYFYPDSDITKDSLLEMAYQFF